MKYLRFLSKVSAMFHVKQYRIGFERPKDKKQKSRSKRRLPSKERQTSKEEDMKPQKE